MKTFLAMVVAVLALAACGDDEPQPSAAPTSEPTSEPTGAPRTRLVREVLSVRTVSQTAGGGDVSPVASRVTGMPPTAPFFEDLSPRLVTKLRDALDEMEARDTVFAQVISVGCYVPPSAAAHFEGDRLVVEATRGVGPKVECLAPVTTVALVFVARSFA